MNTISVIESMKKNIDNITIIIDMSDINNVNDFIEKIYKDLWCPNNFWSNLNAFFDTIEDTQFWVKKPLDIVIKNFNMLSSNLDLRMLISDIFMDIIRIKNTQKYNIYILNEN